MPSDENSGPPSEPKIPGREPLTPAKQKRLEKLFEHGSKQMTQGNHDYATELFEQCLLGDPSNLGYIQAYVSNLQKKYHNNRTGRKFGQFFERGARTAVKKARAQEHWDEVIKHGLKVLTVNPWDKAALTAMATAAGKMGDDEPQLYYLKCAWEANPKDPDINRQTAKVLAARGLYDQAIARWHRVEQVLPDDEEAQREIAKLAVEKTIARGGFDDEEEARLRDRHAEPEQEEEQEISMEDRLKRKIKLNPEEIPHYFDLAQYYITKEQYDKAEDILADAYEVSDGDPDVRERWEDAQIRHLRQQITTVENRGEQQAARKLRKKALETELDVYKNRCQRYPNNLAFKYELALRYQLSGQVNEAIKQYQAARNDPRRKGLCMFRLGQCFQKIKQYRLATSHYESAIEEIPDRDAKNKKDALYHAGKLALGLKNLDAAEKHLARLAGLDFTYRDVSALMDNIGELREKGGKEDKEEEKDEDEE